jgi:hypothetical protein
MVTPAQYRAVEPGSQYSILRLFNLMDLRLYYSGYTAFFSNEEGNVSASPAQAAPPTIVRVSATPNADGTVFFSIRVVGAPSAGIQEAWVTYTAVDEGPLSGLWRSLDLDQDTNDSTLWVGTLDLNGTDARDVRYMVQAANGVGLVTMLTNQGFFYVPGLDPDAGAPTTLTLDEPALDSGVYGSAVTLQATLTTDGGTPLAGEAVSFRLAGQTRIGITDGDGLAAVEIPLLGFPGTYEMRATFRGNFDYAASSADESFAFTIEPQTPNLTLETTDGYAYEDDLITVTLRDAIRYLRLPEMTLFVAINGDGGSYTVADITTLFGQVTVGDLPLPAGTYDVTAWFADSVPPSGNIADATVSDARYNPAMATGTLTLYQTNNPPTDIGLDSTTVSENAPVGTVIGTFFTVDPDADDTHSYEFVDGDNDNSLFTIEGDVLKTAAIFDFEIQDTYYIQVGSTDAEGASIEKGFAIQVLDANEPPICSGATSDPVFIWSPDKDFWPINLSGITDPNGDEITITILGIFQDEPVGKGANSPDGRGVGTDTAEVRAEREGKGDGRVYHVEFRADDGLDFCTGMLRVAVVAHDQGSEPDIDAIDQGALYDSTVPD